MGVGNIIPGSLPGLLGSAAVIGITQLPGMVMQHRERMAADEAIAEMQKSNIEQQQKFVENMVAGVNAW